MPRRALIEHRPWLLTSLVAAIAFYTLSDEQVGGAFLLLFKGSACATLAIYALSRHAARGGWLIAVVMALSSAGDVAMELASETWGGGLFLAAHLVAIVLYRLNARPHPAGSQIAAAVALALFTPLLAFLLTGDPFVAFYALGLGTMAACAWLSRFSRYNVGLGAVLFVVSDLLIFARLGGRLDQSTTEWLVWPFYYAGQFLIVTGVIRKLKRDHQA